MLAFQFKVILHLPIIITIVIEHFHHHCQLPRDRPDFPSLAQTLERLPKKRLARFSNQTRIIFIASPFHLLETQFCVTFKSISLTLILICFQVSFPSHPSVPQCRGALLRFQIATFESRFPGNLGCHRASIPRTSSTPSNFSENVELAKSDRHQPKHSLVNISVGIKAASTHDSISNL